MTVGGGERAGAALRAVPVRLFSLPMVFLYTRLLRTGLAERCLLGIGVLPAFHPAHPAFLFYPLRCTARVATVTAQAYADTLTCRVVYPAGFFYPQRGDTREDGTMRILLCCNAGMSTSLLVTKMQEAARELGVDAEIWAVSVDDVKQHIDRANVLLVGPQMRYKLPELKKEGEARGIPVEAISPTDYGLVNGKKVLEFALSLAR